MHGRDERVCANSRAEQHLLIMQIISYFLLPLAEGPFSVVLFFCWFVCLFCCLVDTNAIAMYPPKKLAVECRYPSQNLNFNFCSQHCLQWLKISGRRLFHFKRMTVWLTHCAVVLSHFCCDRWTLIFTSERPGVRSTFQIPIFSGTIFALLIAFDNVFPTTWVRRKSRCPWKWQSSLQKMYNMRIAINASEMFSWNSWRYAPSIYFKGD